MKMIPRVLFIFLDGIGLGENNSKTNPLVKASLPYLNNLLEGRKLILDSAPSEGKRFTLLPLDACLNVKGMPQSATGQAVILTGRNIPQEIGYHYGPKPDDAVANIVSNGNIFISLKKMNKTSTFLNAYPKRYFDALASGRRLLSSIPLAVQSSGLRLHTTEDLYSGQAMSADFTGTSWRTHLGMLDAPIYNPREAGIKLFELSTKNHFTFFEYWLSDYAGHSQEMDYACELLELIDGVFEGLIENWVDDDGLIFITSDHGNMEDLSTHRHTMAPVPGLIIGSAALRKKFSENLTDLTGIAPSILSIFNNN